MGTSLEGYAILVTRPEEQARSLNARISDAGGTPLSAPMVSILPVDDPSKPEACVQDMTADDIVIFVSRNSVSYGLPMLESAGRELAGHSVFAVGVGTAATLEQHGVTGVITPKAEFSSEGLLKLEGLQAREVEGRRVTIFRGEGGREHLGETLLARRAEVNYCEVYHRGHPNVVISDVLQAHDVKLPDAGIVTSVEALQNLATCIESEQIERLFDMALFVVGPRIAAEVEGQGFTNPAIIVDNATDDKILHALERWVLDEYD